MAMDEGQAMPAEGAAEQQGGGDTGQIFNDVANGLAVVTDAVMKSQAPDDLKSRMQGILQEFVGVLQELTGGQAAPAGGVEAAEQGAGGQPFSQAGV